MLDGLVCTDLTADDRCLDASQLFQVVEGASLFFFSKKYKARRYGSSSFEVCIARQFEGHEKLCDGKSIAETRINMFVCQVHASVILEIYFGIVSL